MTHPVLQDQTEPSVLVTTVCGRDRPWNSRIRIRGCRHGRDTDLESEESE